MQITRVQERRLYEFLRDRCEDDSLRYELIAKKIQRVADGYGDEFDIRIVKDWLEVMQEMEQIQEKHEVL